jgi:hypothetical protein
MDASDEIDQTAKDFFLAKVVNGKVPEVVVGGEHDGLRYFTTEIGDTEYWVTESGLMLPLTADSCEPSGADAGPASDTASPNRDASR